MGEKIASSDSETVMELSLIKGEQGEKKVKSIKRRFSLKNPFFYVILQNIKGHEIKNTI
jgi:hypothetical protein